MADTKIGNFFVRILQTLFFVVYCGFYLLLAVTLSCLIPVLVLVALILLIPCLVFYEIFEHLVGVWENLRWKNS